MAQAHLVHFLPQTWYWPFFHGVLVPFNGVQSVFTKWDRECKTVDMKVHGSLLIFASTVAHSQCLLEHVFPSTANFFSRL